jgi:hypothetical protein
MTRRLTSALAVGNLMRVHDVVSGLWAPDEFIGALQRVERRYAPAA